MSDQPAAGTARSAARLHAEWTEFRRAWLDYLGSPYGLLSPVGLYWLSDRPESFDDVPGSWWVEDSRRLLVRAAADDGLVLEDRPVDGVAEVFDATRPREVRTVRHGDVVISPVLFPAQTSQPVQLGIQPRDPYVASRRLELGVPTYPFDPKWIVPARYEPYEGRRPVVLRSMVENKVKDLGVFGRVVFELGDGEHALEVYAGPEHELHIPFRDRTSGVTTFAGARLVFAPRPASANGGAFEFELDFNRTVNGPCGFSPYTTCALPPPGNTLPVAIEAGEQLPLWMEQPSAWAR
ncbi:DUF1684 domain-containing protein [Amycolatopsis endophytica]|uniref:DUF1684 domain-containing protein n=1 Tax=Amycolatopsis endophytica TaxID=860233 RepID=A0A853BAH8_9PSEU|nr:DUF1684 domain-containing protein [Amycolatopsis endophytica]NYI91752.1 hypothetical protein [Amycolatopsis endophytica]